MHVLRVIWRQGDYFRDKPWDK